MSAVNCRPSLQYRQMIESLKEMEANLSLGTSEQELRRIIERMGRERQLIDPKMVLKDLEITETIVHNRPVYRFKKPHQQPNHVLYYVFGGSYITPPVKRDYYLIEKLINTLNCEVCMPIYPMYPDTSLSKICAFTIEAYKELLQDFTPNQVQFFGLSSGAGLCLNMFVYDRMIGGKTPYPKHMVLISPIAQMPPTEKQQSLMDNIAHKDPILHPKFLKNMLPVMAEETFPGLVSPINALIADICPLTLIYGTHEVFYAFHEAYEQFAKEHEVQMRTIYGEELCHCWITFLGTDESEALFKEVVEDIEYFFNQ